MRKRIFGLLRGWKIDAQDELRQVHEKTPPHGNIDVEFFPSVNNNA